MATSLVTFLLVFGAVFSSTLCEEIWDVKSKKNLDVVAGRRPTKTDEHTGPGRAPVGHARNKRFVQLGEGDEDPLQRSCSLPGGEEGVCRRGSSLCIPDRARLDFVKYSEYLCVYNSTSIGTCCPQNPSESAGLAGDLPQSVDPKENSETLLRITTARSRGCGVSTASNSRLVGARPADPREWPWMAAVMADGREQYCGGTLITDRHVLTAAHCTRRWKAADMQVRLGEYDFRRRNDSRSYDFRVLEIRQHADFQLQTYRNDIAILKLHRPVVFNTYVWPICLPPVGRDFTNQTLVVIGWGTQSYGGPVSDVLMEVAVPAWPHDKCASAFTDPIYDTVLCAGGYSGGADSCQGDSGGPLMYRMESGRWAQVGVVSWGLKCGEPSHPGVYTNVQNYLRWIVENTRF